MDVVSGADVAHWVEKVDPKSGRAYWGNVRTKETTWTEPAAIKEWRASSKNESYYSVLDEASKREYFVCQRTKLTTWIKPLGKVIPAPAQTAIQKEVLAKEVPRKGTLVEEAKVTTQDVEAKYSDTIKQDLAQDQQVWVECPDKARGRSYYYNPTTGKTTWTQPPESAQILSPEAWKKRQAAAASKQESVQKLDTISKTVTEETEEQATEGQVSCAEHREDGTVHGWLWLRRDTDAEYTNRFFCLHDQLDCYPGDTDVESGNPEYSFVFDPYTLVELSEDELASEFCFVIKIMSENITWLLAMNSIEDMQLWLEALQVLSRRHRITHNRTVSQVDRPSEAMALPRQRASTNYRRSNTRSSGRRKPSEVMRDRRGRSSLAYLSEQEQPTSSKSAFPLENTPKESFEDWAQAAGFGELVPQFKEAGYDDIDLITQLNDDDLKEMLAEHVKLDKPGHRMKIVLAVRALRT
uniref:Uncharacterized protein n=1 Tax=Mucochytrium quahogii TaxID=96639 RepID=A0A7S2WTR8_9STRA|mmetsp:Transcript_2883/g.4143  ORF Transcript_2883/g.4143 Transcript_2883/m.4143 type:complete len:467 (+) Transcript_2883:143-1543(+)